MSKNYHKRFRQKNTSIRNYPVEEQEIPFTNDPTTTNMTGTGNWHKETATTAASSEEDEYESEQFSPAPNNWPTFTTDLLRGQININSFIVVALLIIWFSACVWILIQDNGNQLLQSTNGWIMYGNKIGAITIFVFATLLLFSIYLGFIRLLRWMRRKKKK